MRVPPNHSSHGWAWLSIYRIVMETSFFWWQNPDGCNFKIFKLPYSPQQIVDFPSRKNNKSTSILSQETTIPVLKSSIWSNFPKSPKKSDKSRIILKKNRKCTTFQRSSQPLQRVAQLHKVLHRKLRHAHGGIQLCTTQGYAPAGPQLSDLIQGKIPGKVLKKPLNIQKQSKEIVSQLIVCFGMM